MTRAVLPSLFAAVVLVAGCKSDPSTPEHWEKSITSHRKAKERVRVVDELRVGKLANASFLPMLHDHLQKDKSAEVKGALAKVLGEVKDPSSVEPLINALDMGNPDSTGHAMNKDITMALGAIGDKKAVPTLLRLVKSKDNYTRIEAINALGALKASEAVKDLVAIATDEGTEPFVAKKAIQALGEIGDPTAAPALIRMMFKERRGISFYVESSFGLYQMGKPAADVLVPILNGQDKEVFAWAKDNNVIEPAIYAKVAQVLGDLHDSRAEKALLSKLNFESDFLDVKLFVRIRMADALGRMRSKDAVKALAGMLDEEEATARQEYIRALVRIGAHEASPALAKSASKGSWDAREPAMVGLAMLGTEADLATFDKFMKDEEKLTADECKADPDYMGCKDIPALVKKHVEAIASMRKRLEAAKDCKSESSCWAKKLDDADAGVRERAAYEVGRSGNAELIGELTKRLEEKNLDTRLAIIQATDWLVSDSKQAGQKAAEHASALEQQIAQEKGKTEFVKVNEDLRRLLVKLKRQGA